MIAPVSGRSAAFRRWISFLLGHKWVIAGVLLVAALGFEALFAVTVVSNTACTVCHTSGQAERRQEGSSHADLGCTSCHRQDGALGLAALNVRAAGNLGTALLPGVGAPPERLEYVPSRCVACHEEALISTVTSGDIKMSHAAPLREGWSCAVCHIRAGHPDDEAAKIDLHSRCAECHTTDIASRDCLLCHVAPDPTVSSADPSHQAGWDATHGAGDLVTCSLCHQPSYCRECHDVDLPHRTSSFIFGHGSEARDPSACTDLCHSQKSCDACHQIPMPHPSEYLPAHKDEAIQFGPEVCSGCHLEIGCIACHVRHIHPGIPDSLRQELSTSGGGD